MPSRIRSLSRPLVSAVAGPAVAALFAVAERVGPDRARRIASAQAVSRLHDAAVSFLFEKKNHYFDENLRLVFPRISDAEIAAFKRTCYQNVALASVESMFMTERDFDASTIHGLEHLRAAGKSGVIFVSCHLSNWDLIKRNNQLLGYPTSFLYRSLPNARVDEVVRRVRARWSTPVPVSAVPRFIAKIEAGENVLFMPDIRVNKGRNRAKLLFCGHRGWTSTFIAEMALTHRRPIVPVYVTRTKDGGYAQVFEAAIDVSSGDKKLVQQKINDSMSARILAAPESWTLWNTNRWGP